MPRCPSCNANRTQRVETMKDKLDKPIFGTRCTVCGAQWNGDLFTNKELGITQ